MTANVACKEAIETAIWDHYAGYSLDAVPAAREVVKQFGYDRTLYVLANSVQKMDQNGRIARQCKEWAWTLPVVGGSQWRFTVSGTPN